VQKDFLISAGLLLLFYVNYSALLHIYSTIWRYADIIDFLKVSFVVVASFFTLFIADFIIVSPQIDELTYLYCAMTALLALILARMMYILLKRRKSYDKSEQPAAKKNILIIGAGYMAQNILTQLLRGKSGYNPVGLVDDDITKIGRKIYDVTILGCTDDIPDIVAQHNVQTIIFAIPSLDDFNKKRILNICIKTPCEIKIIPYMTKIIEKVDLLSKMRDVKIEDLLGREQVELELCDIHYIKDKVCMVTGGGGSIGSELCRQIAQYKPKHLVIVDNYENNIYDIQQELIRRYGESLNMSAIIADVADNKKMDLIFKRHSVDVIFHAAAHKHVPLMEDNPEEAIKNNIKGTLNIAQLAHKYSVKKFIMISTDKAVNPTNVMGATKRLCELIVYSYFLKTGGNCEYVSVRFGNVLGSNGSVIPLFKQQIREGGPVTVTHPEITRYFMTISEAVSLVLHAGALAKGGEIFVLDMGKPVKIVTLAENLIKLSGYQPYKDIDIKFIGLRPGEKLYEELLLSEEGLKETENKKIFIGKQVEIEPNGFLVKMRQLIDAAENNQTELILALLKEYIPNFNHNNGKNGVAQKTAEG
jgi:FlaA1/EpsC-like NDP-sugar epimerase